MILNTNTFTRFLLAGVAVCLLAAAASGDVVVSYYNGPDHWNFRRDGIPDLDQQRDALPNDGACHCVPTCTMNLLMYAANHGFPEIEPGPRTWDQPADYVTATAAINLLANSPFMGICYGDVVGCLPDDDQCDSNNDGDCACGSTNAANAVEGLRTWLESSDADEKLTLGYWSAKDDGQDLRLRDLFAMSFLEGAPLIRVNYGRYEAVNCDGSTVYRRTGGHAMSFVGCRAFQGDMRLLTMNPATCLNDGNPCDLISQSTFHPDEYTVADVVVGIRRDAGPPCDIDVSHLSYLGTTSDGELQLLDTIAWIRPKNGYTFTPGIIYGIPAAPGFGTPLSGPSATPISGGSVVDVVLDPIGLGCIALVLPEVGAPQVKYVDRVIGEESLIAEIGGAVALATGRQHDLYVVTDVAGGGSATRRFTPLPQGELSDYQESSDTLTLPHAVHGAVFDDETDELVMVSTSAAKLVRAPRDLGAGTPQVSTWDIPTTVPMTGDACIAVEPGEGRTWLVTSASHSLYGLTVNAAGQVQVETISRPNIQSPTGVGFDDTGRMYVKADAGAIVLKRDPLGLWQRDTEAETPFNGVVLGEKIFMDRSRSNYDPDNVDQDAWQDIPPSELEFLGVPYCPADVDGNEAVGVTDLLILLGVWGADPGGPPDFDADFTVGVTDLLFLLAAWGPCP